MGRIKETLMSGCGDACNNPGNCKCVPTVSEAKEELEKALQEALDTFEPWPAKAVGPCECGGDKAGCGTHASYCPKYGGNLK